MTQREHRRATRRFGWAGAAMLAAVATAATACGGGSASNPSGGGGGSSAGGGTSSGAAPAGGNGGSASTVKVVNAGSLDPTMEKLEPAFKKATGDGFQHFGKGSTALANAIKGGARTPDVYISASPKANKIVMPKQEAWYALFAKSPLVIAYKPHGKAAKAFASGKPWYDVVTQPGFTLGATNPTADPKGQKAQAAIQEVAQKTNEPGLAKKIKSHTKQYGETALPARVESGQVDAGFFYSIEAKAKNLKTVSVKPADQAAKYTVTVLENAKHEQAGVDFVGFLLSRKGSSILQKGGFKLVAPAKLTGSTNAVPKKLRSEVGSR
jgi:molybdate/tungstate transport system substrate-binding protein